MRRFLLSACVTIILSGPCSVNARESFTPSPKGSFGPFEVSIEPGFIRPVQDDRIRLRAIAPEVAIRIVNTATAAPSEGQRTPARPETAHILLENVFRERTDLPPGLAVEDAPDGILFSVPLKPGEQRTLRFRRRPLRDGR